MRILTLRYGWLDYVAYGLYIDGDYEYVESIFIENAPHYVFEPLIFKLLKTISIEIIQDYSGKYYWTMF